MANLLRSRTAEQKRKRQLKESEKKTQYICVDGPWEGQRIWLSDDGDSQTAILKIGNRLGYYKVDSTPEGYFVTWRVAP